MLDMVFNHTSTEHEWFQKALAGDVYYKDFYIFRDGKDGNPPTNWQSKFGGTAWEYVPLWNQYYLRLFDKTQADLNWENPAVRRELVKVLKFWIEKGIRDSASTSLIWYRSRSGMRMIWKGMEDDSIPTVRRCTRT